MSPISSSSATALLPVTGRVLMSAIFLVSGAGKLAAPAAPSAGPDAPSRTRP